MATDFTSIELSGTDPEFGAKLNAYIVYEYTREIRRALMRKLAPFVVGVGILSLGVHFLPSAAFVVTLAAAAWIAAVAHARVRAARKGLVAELNHPSHPERQPKSDSRPTVR